MTKIVYGLFRTEEHVGSFLVDLFSSKESALKQILIIKEKESKKVLADYEELKIPEAKWCYEHLFDHVEFDVKPLSVRE